MAERKSLINKPPSTPGEPQYNQGPDDALTRFFLGLIGDTSGVRPDPNGADWAGLAGGLATLLPIGRIIKMLPGLKPAQLERLVHDIGAGESVASRMARGGEGSLAEFKPLEGLGDESIAKAVRPRDPRADGGLPNQFVDVNFPPETPKPLYHGTKRDFKNFSTAKGDKADFLGNWLHFAEDPEHAARVPLEKELPTDAQGLVPAEYLDPAKRPRPDYMTEPMSEAKGLNIRPTMVSRSNQLDVTRTALSAKMIQDAEELLRHIPTKSWGRAFLGQALQRAKLYMKPEAIVKYADSLAETLPEVAANLKDEMLRAVQNHPEAAKAAGFDAIRYIDQPGWGENYSVAVPSAFQAKPALRKPGK